MSEIVLIGGSSLSNQILLQDNLKSTPRSRIKGLVQWLDEHKLSWLQLDLVGYRDYLLDERELDPVTVRAHLSTIRGRYLTLITSNDLRERIFELIRANNPTLSFIEQQSMVQELFIRLSNSLSPKLSRVKVIEIQDHAEEDFLRLTSEQFQDFLSKPDISTLHGLRNVALFALMGCTGIRQGELRNLLVSDLYSHYGKELALLIREGKRGKQRLVPYGPLNWCLDYVQVYLESVGIIEGPVFRPLFKARGEAGDGALSQVSINKIFREYPVMIDGVEQIVPPHGLRRMYAKLAWESGMDILVIQQNLGHQNRATTERYIGALDAEKRRPPAFIQAPMSIEQLRAASTTPSK